MIGRLSGTLLKSTTSEVLLDVGGVGYELAIPLSTFDRLPRENERCTLWVHTQVREDAITLYGFATEDEKSLFRILIAASGIGGKLALNILGSMPIDSFCAAIVSADLKILSHIGGVGKRTAEKMIVELKKRISEFRPQSCGAAQLEDAAVYNDALGALQSLGFSRETAVGALNAILEEHPNENLDCEALIRMALAGKGR